MCSADKVLILFLQPHVRVWNSVSLATLAVIGAGQMERAVACVTFSRADGGALLAAVDDGPDHTISVWEWQRSDKHCLAETKVCALLRRAARRRGHRTRPHHLRVRVASDIQIPMGEQTIYLTNEDDILHSCP